MKRLPFITRHANKLHSAQISPFSSSHVKIKLSSVDLVGELISRNEQKFNIWGATKSLRGLFKDLVNKNQQDWGDCKSTQNSSVYK